MYATSFISLHKTYLVSPYLKDPEIGDIINILHMNIGGSGVHRGFCETPNFFLYWNIVKEESLASYLISKKSPLIA